MTQAQAAVESAEDAYADIDSHLRDFADWFHERQGELLQRSDAATDLALEFDVEVDHANKVISHLVGDRVDPVVQVDDGETLWVGVIRYDEGDIFYEYDDYHPAFGLQPKVVCAQCVHEATYDHEVAYAAPGEGTLSPKADVSLARTRVWQHFEDEHPNVSVESVETGASLVAPTTIGGNEAIHKGNMSTEADADTVDGKHAGDLAPSFNDGTINAYITSLERFGAEGSQTTSTGYVTISGSDITFDPDEYEDTGGTVYIRMKAHLFHNGAGTTFARILRQNAGTAVSGSEVSKSGDGWGVADSGWIDLSADTGNESYQIQLRTDDGATGRYNSILLFFGVPT